MSESQIIRKKSENALAEWARFEASNPARKSLFDQAAEKDRAETRNLKTYFSGLPAVKAISKPSRGALLDSFNQYYALQNRAITAASSNFVGFSYLSFLAQDALINRGVSVIADEMTREWGELNAEDDQTTEMDESRSGAIKIVNEELARLNVKELFRQASRTTGFFGGCLAYLDLRGPSGEPPDDRELLSPIYIEGRDAFNESKLRDLTLHGIKLIEPINLVPGGWQANSPLEAGFYDPEIFYVLGKPVHKSRFLYFADNLPPQALKPCYQFFGISTSQMAAQYVNDFYHLKDSVTKMLTKYSLTYFATPTDALIEKDGPEAVANRVATLNKYRDNESMLVISSDNGERIEQINTPLAGCKDIWYASLELLPVIFGVPATKLLEISPSGFNATGEFEMRNFYDSIAVKQSNIFDTPMKRLLDILCLVNGVKNPGLIWKWNSLYKLSDREAAETARIRAETASVYYSLGAVSAEDVAESLRSDPESGFTNIDVPGPGPDDDDLETNAEGQNPDNPGPAAPATNEDPGAR